ncbi:MAG: hypothetical protein K6C33_08950 [Desulfovibrio sp.]|nr:hypothetical protein [Desulfovibrio sp.]
MTPKAVAALLRGASRGDADAMARLAHRYHAGDGVPKDPDQALRWALASADAGSPRGAYLAGLMLAERNNPDDGSLQQAQILLRQAADAGYGHADEVLRMLRTGMVPKERAETLASRQAGSLHAQAQGADAGEADYASGSSRLEAERRAGDPEDLFGLGCALLDGDGVAKDVERGLSLLEQSASQGCALAQVVLAEGHLKREFPASDPARGAELLAQAAACRNARVLALCARLYEEDLEGLTPDLKRARHCLRQAADMGDAEAQFLLALKLVLGEGMPRNPSRAAGYARKAAAQDFAPAQRLLGKMHADGLGVAASLKKAFFWFSKAAEAGDEDALVQKALLLSEGRGCRQDRVQACEILEGLAIGGSAQAECLLAGVLCESRDSAEAGRGMAMLRRLAGKGDVMVQSALGVRLLKESADADPQAGKASRNEARAWLEKVAAKGGKAAAQMLAESFGMAPPVRPDETRRPRRLPGLARLGFAKRRKKQ